MALPALAGAAPLPILLAGLLGYCLIQYFDFPRERIELQVILAVLFAFIVFYSRTIWAGLPGLSLVKRPGLFLNLAYGSLLFNLLLGWYRIDGEIHNVRAMQALGRNDYPAVLTEAQATRNLFYEYNDVVLPLQWYDGIAHLKLRRADLAVADFAAAYRLNPWSFQVLNNYALALAMNRQQRESLPRFEQMLAINPRYAEGKLNFAYTLYEIGEYARAAEWINRLDTIPNPQTDDERTKNQLLLGKQAEFRQRLQKHGF